MKRHPGEARDPAAHAGIPADPRLLGGSPPIDDGLGSGQRDQHHEDPAYSGSDAGLSPVYGPAGIEDDQLWAMMAYLGMIFFAFAPPLAVYLVKRRESPFVRFHAAQALNLWITVFCYSLSFVIIGAVLLLDTVATGLTVGLLLIAAAGVAMLGYAILGAIAASRGSLYRMPNWICAKIIKS
jgi:uncharacterized protein